MSGPPSQERTHQATVEATRQGSSTWSGQWIEDAHASLPDAPTLERPAYAARLAAMLFACGHDGAAEAVLSSVRREVVRAGDAPGIIRVEVALADGAICQDNDARALGHLAAARQLGHPIPPSVAARAWIVEARLARADRRPAPPWEDLDLDGPHAEVLDPSERIDLGAELSLERAMAARFARDWVEARAHLERALALATSTSSPRLIALAEVEIGLYTAEVGDPAEGYARIRRAIEILAESGLKRDEGRAMIRLAEMVASHRLDQEHDSAALWLGRAKAALGETATWRDRSSIRTGFRAHGRRLFDRVMTEETAARIEAFERARGALLSAISISVEGAERALNELEVDALKSGPSEPLGALLERVRGAALSMSANLSPAVGDVDRVVHDLIDFISAALVERNRLRNLLDALSDVDAATDRAALPPLVARAAGRILEADHVVVALAKDGKLEEAGRWGEAANGAGEPWKAAASRPHDRGSSHPPAALLRRSDSQTAGPVLVVPLRASDVEGIIYADKLARNGHFREQDHALALLLAEYSALALGRLAARERERMALGQLAVTLDAIRDGVVSWDRDGTIRSTNAAFDRMLRVAREDLLGERVARVPALAPLWAAVSATPRLDGTVVRLSSGSFVVSARPLGSGEDGSEGVVATLVELDRAQKIAQKIGASRSRYGFHDVVGSSPSLLRAVGIARQAANIDSTVLITGESGTGKEIIAQAIHTCGVRAGEPFIGLNVAALPRELLEAELFGYERGAFTGARSEGNLGKFELAGAGTILLDEIGEMPLDMQAKLLRVLQERVVVRLGGSAERPVNARVMATTHRDLSQLVDEGKFRMDLLYRLRVLSIELPPLRERPEDIEMLARHYLARFAEQQRKRVVDLGPQMLDELSRYDWPGNIRELANVMESEVSLLPADTTVLTRFATRLVGRFRGTASITTGEFRASSTGEFRASGTGEHAALSTGEFRAPTLGDFRPSSTGELRALEPPPFSPLAPVIPLVEVEKKAYLHALERNGQSVARAAEALGVSKVTFYARLRSWGMHPRDRFDEEGPTSVRRQRVSVPAGEPFEPPTRTSTTKLPTEK